LLLLSNSQSFGKYLLSTSYVPATDLSAGDTGGDRQAKFLPLGHLHFPGRHHKSNKENACYVKYCLREQNKAGHGEGKAPLECHWVGFEQRLEGNEEGKHIEHREEHARQKETSGAKALRQEHAWCAEGTTVTRVE
jgi:hypothetical protein